MMYQRLRRAAKVELDNIKNPDSRLSTIIIIALFVGGIIWAVVNTIRTLVKS